jgi:2-phospho-L-lactate guanylyltransferase
MTRTVAVLPVKRFGSAKQRLGENLTPGSRRALAEAMVIDVLIALRRAQHIHAVVVITGEPSAEALAHGYGAESAPDPDDAGHVQAAVRGIHWAVAHGAGRALLVPGDCPALDPKELDALLAEEPDGPEVVIVPDRHGTGTNALVLSPPDVITPAFGPGSRERHEQLAAEAGVACRVVEVPTLVLDVDTSDDLQALEAALQARTGGASHTRGFLAHLGRR